jgi:hypothetical protein
MPYLYVGVSVDPIKMVERVTWCLKRTITMITTMNEVGVVLGAWCLVLGV